MRVAYDTIRVTRMREANPMSTMPRNETVPEPTRKIKCKYCEKEFTPRKKWQLFCKSKCRYGYHNDMNAPTRIKVNVTES